jgi:peptidoglycan/LPS O-acetylase OafA/YrhL
MVRYFDEINLLRAFAILAMISIHVSAYFKEMSAINILATVYMSIQTFSQFAVPLFVGISGFVLYNRYPGKIDLKKFYKKRLLSIVPPYIVFSTFYLGVTTIVAIALSKPVNLQVSHILYQYLTGSCFYFLWFIILIIQFYLLYPAIVWTFNYCDLRGRSFELLVVAFIIGVFYFVYAPRVVTIIPLLEVAPKIVATKFLGYLFYFMLGMTVRSRYDELPLKPVSRTSFGCVWIFLLCCTIIGIVDNANSFLKFNTAQILPVIGNYGIWLAATIVSPVYYVIIFALCFFISRHIVSHKTSGILMLEKIGHNSFGIYLVHAFMLYVIVMVFPRFGFDWNTWLFYPCAFCLTLILSIYSVEIIQRFPHSEYIIGSTR